MIEDIWYIVVFAVGELFQQSLLNKEKNMKVADFFCGGGFSEGFRQAGFEIVFAVDKWEPAVNT